MPAHALFGPVYMAGWSVLLCGMACAAGEAKGQKPAPSYVGLRRSSYGLRAKNGDDKWWVERAKEHPHFRCLPWVDFTANEVRSR